MSHPSTTLARAGIATDAAFSAVVPPLYLSSNFAFASLGDKPRYDYTRSGNPTRDVLGDALAQLEGGAGGVVTATGMAAVSLVTQLLRPEDVLVAPHDCYGGTHRLFTQLQKRGALQVAFLDQRAPDIGAQIALKKPRIVWIETPSNPLLRITDIAAVAAAAHAVGAWVVVDNTFLSPLWQQAIALGADIVVHSTTKYINGHGDVVGGAVIAKDKSVHEELVYWANCTGVTGAPFDAYLTLRGLRTLDARLRVHLENAEALVTTLCAHAAVERVYYPGLSSHPGHQLARTQQKAFGAMLSFELKGGRAQIEAFVSALRHFTLAESLGGVESLVAHPASMTHVSMDAEARRIAGISEQLLRVSVGIEHAGDLCADFQQALDAALSAAPQTPARAQSQDLTPAHPAALR